MEVGFLQLPGAPCMSSRALPLSGRDAGFGKSLARLTPAQQSNPITTLQEAKAGRPDRCSSVLAMAVFWVLKREIGALGQVKLLRPELFARIDLARCTPRSCLVTCIYEYMNIIIYEYMPRYYINVYVECWTCVNIGQIPPSTSHARI